MALAAETKRVVDQFEYTDDQVNKGVKEFLRQLTEGLERDGTSLSQIPSYVTGVPKGNEKGLYMAADLGGTNFRVWSILLNGNGTLKSKHTKVEIKKSLMTAETAGKLFAFLAEQIESFLKEHHKDCLQDKEVLRLGFTFSFPVNQVGINKGNLIRWTKGFNIPDAIGQDVCGLLQAEINKLELPVKVAALVNDTVGTLMARSYTSPGKKGTILGAIFGTGTNGAYVEKLANIKKPMTGEYDTSTGEMVINTEWGSFDNQLKFLPKTRWDEQLNSNSNNVGSQMFEKRVSGMFLGEIVRLAVRDIMQNEDVQIFKDAPQLSGIFEQWGLDSSIMSDAAKDTTPELNKLRESLNTKLGIPAVSLEDAQAFKDIAGAVGRRAARLSAVAVAAIVLQTGKLTDPAWKDENIDIGVDGSLVEHYPNFRLMIFEALSVVNGVGEDGVKRIRIEMAQDGSGIGAALVAAGMDKKA